MFGTKERDAAKDAEIAELRQTVNKLIGVVNKKTEQAKVATNSIGVIFAAQLRMAGRANESDTVMEILKSLVRNDP